MHGRFSRRREREERREGIERFLRRSVGDVASHLQPEVHGTELEARVETDSLRLAVPGGNEPVDLRDPARREADVPERRRGGRERSDVRFRPSEGNRQTVHDTRNRPRRQRDPEEDLRDREGQSGDTDVRHLRRHQGQPPEHPVRRLHASRSADDADRREALPAHARRSAGPFQHGRSEAEGGLRAALVVVEEGRAVGRLA
mmetsp:Transcript_11500/g.27459  ORF Transcript_11500/g.27459 Transcript_11500/m.27459 type:complete len:201 (-) Transcript_11500:238-840(-)